jgi:hypothetical protein
MGSTIGTWLINIGMLFCVLLISCFGLFSMAGTPLGSNNTGGELRTCMLHSTGSVQPSDSTGSVIGQHYVST